MAAFGIKVMSPYSRGTTGREGMRFLLTGAANFVLTLIVYALMLKAGFGPRSLSRSCLDCRRNFFLHRQFDLGVPA